MKAYEIHPRDGFGSIVRVERPSPELGPNEVRVRVRATSLNFRDLALARNAAKRAAGTRPNIPLSDGAGEVVEVGSRVTRWKSGDRVAANFFPTWSSGELDELHHAAALGGSADGMLAEEVVLDQAAWVRIPNGWSFEQAATLPCAGLTAFNALFEAAHVRPGDVVLVQGTGGVSTFALQLAKAAGARVIATSSSAEKCAKARELGADHVLDYSADPEWGASARSWTGGRGVDVVVEVGGPGTFDQSSTALRFGGTMSLLGVLTGTKGAVDTHRVFHRHLRIAGVYVGSVTMFEALVRALEATHLEPVVDRTFGFEEARAAYEYLASAGHVGKVVITV